MFVAKLLFEHFEGFKMFKPYVPQTTECIYAKEMSAKLEVLTMAVLMKDENKYSDYVDIEKDKETNEDNTPSIATTSRPDQPAAHVPPTATESDPLRGIKIPCYGINFRVRMAGANDLHAWCHLAKQRLDHLYPFCIVDWHSV